MILAERWNHRSRRRLAAIKKPCDLLFIRSHLQRVPHERSLTRYNEAMERRVVIIEDERDVARLLEFNLKSAGYAVEAAVTGAEGLTAVRTHTPDVVILDLMLPDQSGYDVCKAIRADAQLADTGVLMLTAKGEPEDRILGLEVGADDYVVKPFVVREVVLRVTALANRLAERRARSATSTGTTIKAGPIELDPVTHDVRINGTPTQLRPLEYKLLQLLVSDPGRDRKSVV